MAGGAPAAGLRSECVADAAETVNMKVHVRMVPFTYEYTSFLQCQKMQCKLAVHYLQPLDDSVTAAGDNPVKLRRDALPSSHHPSKTTTVLPPTKKRKTGGAPLPTRTASGKQSARTSSSETRVTRAWDCECTRSREC